MQSYTLPDITPAGQVNLGTVAASVGAPIRAVWMSMTATGTSIRHGDINVGAARGQLLPAAIPFTTHVRGDNPQEPYDLGKIYVFGAGSDKVSITYGY
jgi:hypothetical protein